MSERIKGIVSHVVKQKGYFFVLYGEGLKIFCHISNWGGVELPNVGDSITFLLGPGRTDSTKQQAVMARPEIGAGLDTLRTTTVAGNVEVTTVGGGE